MSTAESSAIPNDCKHGCQQYNDSIRQTASRLCDKCLKQHRIVKISAQLKNNNSSSMSYEQKIFWIVMTNLTIILFLFLFGRSCINKIAELIKDEFLQLITESPLKLKDEEGLIAVADSAPKPPLAPEVDFKGLIILALLYNAVILFFTKLHRVLLLTEEKPNVMMEQSSVGVINPPFNRNPTVNITNAARPLESPKQMLNTNGYYENRSRFWENRFNQRWRGYNVSDCSQRRHNNTQQRFLQLSKPEYSTGNYREKVYKSHESSGIRRRFIGPTPRTSRDATCSRPYVVANTREYIRIVCSFIIISIFIYIFLFFKNFLEKV